MGNPQSKIQNPKSEIRPSPLLLPSSSPRPRLPGAGGSGRRELAADQAAARLLDRSVSDQVRGARSMTLSPKGIVYVGTRDRGRSTRWSTTLSQGLPWPGCRGTCRWLA